MLGPLVARAGAPRDPQDHELAQSRIERGRVQQHVVVREERAGERGVVQQRAEHVRHRNRVGAGGEEPRRGLVSERVPERGLHVVAPFLPGEGRDAGRPGFGHMYQPPLTPISWPVM